MTPWIEYMAVGVALLRLNSRDVWAMTPQEFDAACDACAKTRGRHGAAAPPTREEVADMMQRFPDRPG